ncbi:hypothetical protein DRN98_08330 [Methanosarcinales archaeon]|nr:MAG: hypothetical protein DRN98_08330 [Methanosarcinales archaeon]
MPWYVYKGKKIIAKCYYEPSLEDISSRGEERIFLEEDVNISDYEIVNGKLIKTEEAKKREQLRKVYEEKSKVDGLIDHHLRKKLIKKILDEGLADDELKELVKKREQLAQEEDRLAKELGYKGEDARMH